jgi:hypothetical protein
LYIYAGEDIPSVELEPVAVYIAKIREAKTMAELTSIYNAVALQTKSDASYLPILRSAATEHKSIMEAA